PCNSLPYAAKLLPPMDQDRPLNAHGNVQPGRRITLLALQRIGTRPKAVGNAKTTNERSLLVDLNKLSMIPPKICHPLDHLNRVKPDHLNAWMIQQFPHQPNN